MIDELIAVGAGAGGGAACAGAMVRCAKMIVEKREIDALTVQLTVGFPTFSALCAEYERTGYRPTLRPDLDPRYAVLADAYDAHFEARGLDVRAYRG